MKNEVCGCFCECWAPCLHMDQAITISFQPWPFKSFTKVREPSGRARTLEFGGHQVKGQCHHWASQYRGSVLCNSFNSFQIWPSFFTYRQASCKNSVFWVTWSKIIQEIVLFNFHLAFMTCKTLHFGVCPMPQNNNLVRFIGDGWPHPVHQVHILSSTCRKMSKDVVSQPLHLYLAHIITCFTDGTSILQRDYNGEWYLSQTTRANIRPGNICYWLVLQNIFPGMLCWQQTAP